jgi:hypothetical protein
MMKRAAMLVGVMLCASLALVVAGPTGAGAQSDTCVMTPFYEGTAVVTVSATTVTPGQTIDFVGTGFPPNSTLPIQVNGVDVGSAVTDASGNFTFSYTVPADATGTLTVMANCGSFFLTSTVVIQTPTPTTITTTTVPLVATGSDSVGTVRIALVLIFGGGLLMLLTRRRRLAELAAEGDLAT